MLIAAPTQSLHQRAAPPSGLVPPPSLHNLLALAAALELEGIEDRVVLAAGTDGMDGPTNLAGAIVDGGTVGGRRRIESTEPAGTGQAGSAIVIGIAAETAIIAAGITRAVVAPAAGLARAVLILRRQLFHVVELRQVQERRRAAI